MKHGGDLGEAMTRFGGTRADWLDLSTGINPFAYPVRAVGAESWKALPGQGALDNLLAAARRAYAVPDHLDIVAAPGTQAIIQWLPRLAPQAGLVGIAGPTYSEHARAWRQAGFATAEFRLGKPLPETIGHAVIVHPNNPDGRLASPAEALALAERVAGQGGWLVVDEAFIDVAPAHSLTATLQHQPAITLRSFGKFYGLAGLRLGFAIGPASLIAPLRDALGPWAVPGAALAVATEALADGDWAEAMRQRLDDEAQALDRVLHRYGFVSVGGTALYRLARMPVAGMHQALAEHRIWTRCFEHDSTLLRFGLPAGPVAREKLVVALAAIRHG